MLKMRTRKLLCLIVTVLSLEHVLGEGQEQLPRDGRQLPNESEQKYEFELSFPVDSDEATKRNGGDRERIEALIQSLLIENQALVS